MAMVKFATTCDHCAARSAEYEAWPTCRTCKLDVCGACQAPNSETLEEADDADGVAQAWLTARCAGCEEE